MKRQVVIKSTEDLDRLEQSIIDAVQVTTTVLRTMLATADGLATFAQLKFTNAGRDPLEPERPLNVIEQLNQTFTCLASVAGARWLVEKHPECLPAVLNLGTASGYDIQSICGRFVAETFAVTHPASNDKLQKDVRRMQNAEAENRFIFYLSPDTTPARQVPGVTIVRLDHPVIRGLPSDA